MRRSSGDRSTRARVRVEGIDDGDESRGVEAGGDAETRATGRRRAVGAALTMMGGESRLQSVVNARV